MRPPIPPANVCGVRSSIKPARCCPANTGRGQRVPRMSVSDIRSYQACPLPNHPPSQVGLPDLRTMLRNPGKPGLRPGEGADRVMPHHLSLNVAEPVIGRRLAPNRRRALGLAQALDQPRRIATHAGWMGGADEASAVPAPLMRAAPGHRQPKCQTPKGKPPGGDPAAPVRRRSCRGAGSATAGVSR
jgi:hypothetical protein